MKKEQKVPGGVGNTPLTSPFLEINHVEKQVLIDYLSVTFDFPKIKKIRTNFYEVEETLEFNRLLYLLGFEKPMSELQRIPGKNGYIMGFLIGEHIELFYGSEIIKNRYGNYTMNLSMTGKACRELERYRNRNFKDLYKFLLSFDNTAFKRTDYALDIFEKDIISIYDIKPYLERGHYISPLKIVNMNITDKNTPLGNVGYGFTIYVGKDHANQLIMYDKYLEQQAKNKEADYSLKDVDWWERYEMRIKDDKAKTFASEYVLAIESGESGAFMKIVNELMLYMLELKIPCIDGKPTKNKKIKLWDTEPKWLAFLNSNEKIDLGVNRKLDTTIESSMKWSFKSLKKVVSSIFMSLDESDKTFGNFLYGLILEGLKDTDPKLLERINNYRKDKGLKEFDMLDVKDFEQAIKELLEYEDEDSGDDHD